MIAKVMRFARWLALAFTLAVVVAFLIRQPEAAGDLAAKVIAGVIGAGDSAVRFMERIAGV